MKHKMNLMGLVLALGGMLLSGCGSSTKPSTSNSTETPSTSTSTGGEETSSTFTREDAKRIFQEALDADYSNMIVAMSMSYDLGNGVQDEYIEEIVYNDYTIIPALYDGDTTLYYHDYEGESYLYFPDNYGHGDGWLNKGEKDSALGDRYVKELKRSNSITHRYTHLSLKPVIAAANIVSEKIAELMGI